MPVKMKILDCFFRAMIPKLDADILNRQSSNNAWIENHKVFTEFPNALPAMMRYIAQPDGNPLALSIRTPQDGKALPFVTTASLNGYEHMNSFVVNGNGGSAVMDIQLSPSQSSLATRPNYN